MRGLLRTPARASPSATRFARGIRVKTGPRIPLDEINPSFIPIFGKPRLGFFFGSAEQENFAIQIGRFQDIDKKASDQPCTAGNENCLAAKLVPRQVESCDASHVRDVFRYFK
jgi:hypothetical protein